MKRRSAKKSKVKKGSSQRCTSCRSVLRNDVVGKVVPCPGCDLLFCGTCAFGDGGRKFPEFISCSSIKCSSPPRCQDCSSGVTHEARGEENRKRRQRGEEIVIVEHCHDNPMFTCGNERCNEILCFECATWQTEGQDGHAACFKCWKKRCLKCAMTVGTDDFITQCSGCEDNFCLSCDPDFHIGSDGLRCSTCHAATLMSACGISATSAKPRRAKPKPPRRAKPCANKDCKSVKGSETFRCTGCRAVRYCGDDCQKIMWPMHRGECKEMQEKLRENSTETRPSFR